MLTGAASDPLIRRALPLLAITTTVATLALVLGTAGESLGYDYEAYVRAAQRIIDGQPLYDPTIDVAGGFAIYLYPPPFALGFLPFALLPDALGPWPWIGLLVAAFVAGVAALPVSRDVRWLVLLLGGLDWPVLYGLRLGQVSALLFLLFALSWRWMDRPGRFGLTAALGALVKLQPGLLLAWAVLTHRWRAVAVGVVVLLLAGGVSTVVIGPQAWVDYADLVRSVSNPITTPHNFTPGAIAYQLGTSIELAAAIQVGSTVLAVGAVLLAIRFASPAASLLTTIVASQLVSPLLWDHYAIVLLLPVAYLLERRQWWAAAIPLATAFPLIGVTPPVVYPVAFVIALLAPLAVDLRRSPESATAIGWVG